jgi:putative acetyltransferase
VFTLRPYTTADAPALMALFRDTIRRVNVRDYTEEQVRAWAPDDIEPVRWTSRFEGRFVVVAEADGRPVGFAELEADGHIDRFYVLADHQGIGVGRAMIEAVIAEGWRLGLPRLFTEASITARPFFERFGFVVLAEQTVTVRGVALTNYRMENSFGG